MKCYLKPSRITGQTKTRGQQIYQTIANSDVCHYSIVIMSLSVLLLIIIAYLFIINTQHKVSLLKHVSKNGNQTIDFIHNQKLQNYLLKVNSLLKVPFLYLSPHFAKHFHVRYISMVYQFCTGELLVNKKRFQSQFLFLHAPISGSIQVNAPFVSVQFSDSCIALIDCDQ